MVPERIAEVIKRRHFFGFREADAPAQRISDSSEGRQISAGSESVTVCVLCQLRGRSHVVSAGLVSISGAGGRSTIVPAATQEELKKVLPQAQFVTMPGLGHYPHVESPEEYLKIVEGFLGK